jgi:hypothetical protein
MTILVSIATLLLMLPTPGQNPRQTISGQKETKPAQSPKTDASNVPAVVAGNGEGDGEARTHNPNYRYPYDPREDCLYRWYMRMTIVGVFGGLIGIGLLIWQAILTRGSIKAANATTNVIINSERSWIMVDVEWKKEHGNGLLYSSSGDGKRKTIGISLNYICRNIGNTFAQITGKGYVFKAFNGSPPQTPDLTDIRWMEFADKYIKPGVDEDTYHLTESFGISQIEDEGPRMMFFYGIVEYRDVYGDHKTIFGYLVNDVPTPSVTRLPIDIWPEYNKHT